MSPPQYHISYTGSPVKKLPPPLSKPPSTKPLLRDILHPQSLFIHLSKSSVNEPSSRFPQTGLLWKEMPVSRTFATYPSGSSAREPYLQVPITEFPQTER
jgi:hypothetical protein